MATHRVITTGVFYKGVTKDLKSPQQINRLIYTEGAVLEADSFDSDPSVSCGHGINFQRTVAAALRWGPVVVEIKVPSKCPIVDTGGKLRAHTVQVGKVVDLTGAYLTGAYLTGAYLTGAYLTGAYLRGANLRGANLRGANLMDADLRGANLMDADLRGANLRDAYLRGANLRGANLRGANLMDADLMGANLRDAYLMDADLRGAILRGAYGTPRDGMPDGWKLGASRLWVKQ